ncbi:MAG: Flp pilus assembly protein CpaB [Alphaproteobacteria bacterium]|nr:Flp pilus assembly protein CpaB [Alphaproteobacteria bacterium]
MKIRALMMLGLAALLGLAAVYLARGWIESQTRKVAEPENKITLTTVVIAKRPLSLGDEITREFLTEAPWPASAVPEGSFRKMEELVKAGNEARVALRSIQVNEPILKHKVTGFGGRATLSTLIEKEMRGFTIRVNDVLGVGGFVTPGDHVDVLLTRKRGKDEHITDVLIQNVNVLGIDQEASDDKDKPRVVKAVTLEVTTDQGQKLALASTVGTLSLALRHSLNSGPIAHRTIRERDLVDENLVRPAEQPKPAAPAKVVQKANPYTSVKVVRGVTATTQEVVIETPGAVRRPAAAAPRQLTPAAPSPAITKDTPKPEAKPAAPAKAPDAVKPVVPGKPIPLWRDKDGKTVQGPAAGEKAVSALSTGAGR